MTEEELTRLRVSKANLKEEISYANKLLFEYKNMSSSNEEEYKKGSAICRALQTYIDDMKRNVSGLDITIKKIEKLYNKIPKRLKELVGKKIKIISVYDWRNEDIVGKVGTVLRVKRDELDECDVLVTDIQVKNFKGENYNYELFVGSDRYRTVKD